MITRSLFSSSKEFEIDSLNELLPLAKSLREEDPLTPYIISVKKCEVRGHMKFPYSNFYIKGNGSRLVDNLYANSLDEKGEELSTWKTATLKVTGDNNIFEGLTVENDAGDPANKGQEVALAVYGDNNLFYRCALISTQDTLFSGPLPDDLSTRYINFIPEDERYREGNCRNYYVYCTIKGTVDFIFGAGQADFYYCDLVTLNDGRKTTCVCAPSHSLKDDFGYFFCHCNFTNENVDDNSIYLARPWRDYGKAVFYFCTYGPHIKKEGFSEWNNEQRWRTARFEEYPLEDGRVFWTKNGKNDLPPSAYIEEEKILYKEYGDSIKKM